MNVEVVRCTMVGKRNLMTIKFINRSNSVVSNSFYSKETLDNFQDNTFKITSQAQLFQIKNNYTVFLDYQNLVEI